MITVDPESYQKQLQQKVSLLTGNLSELQDNLPLPDVFESSVSHYRMRAEFRIWHVGEQAHYAMHDPNTKQIVLMDRFPVASLTINNAMPSLLLEINQSPILKRKLFQAEFLSTQTGELLISLIYHKKLDDEWMDQATQLQKKLNLNIIGRSRKQKVVLTQDFVTETLSVDGTAYRYQQVENSFTQPNAAVCEQMINWACLHGPAEGDLLELYCGNGNFTIPLAKHYRKVLATEVSKTSIKSAKYNLNLNKASNIAIARMASEEVAAAIAGQRQFRRLAEIELGDYNFSTVLVDPPRAGLDDATLELVQQFDNIIYISCNPNTLVSNLKGMQRSYNIKRVAAFDQFPYTHHLEAGIILTADK